MPQTNITTLDELLETATAHFPKFSPEEQRAGMSLLRELARGEPVKVAQWAQALGTPIAEVEALLRTSRLSPYVQMDQDGQVAGFWGLSTVRTHHRLTIEDRTLWAWCAVDTLFLPVLLGETARVESRDPEGGDWVRLTVAPEGIESHDPKGVLMSVNSPGAWDHSSAERVIATTCHFVFFFTSRASGERWVAKQPNTVLVSLEDAFELGKRVNAQVFGGATGSPGQSAERHEQRDVARAPTVIGERQETLETRR